MSPEYIMIVLCQSQWIKIKNIRTMVEIKHGCEWKEPSMDDWYACILKCLNQNLEFLGWRCPVVVSHSISLSIRSLLCIYTLYSHIKLNNNSSKYYYLQDSNRNSCCFLLYSNQCIKTVVLLWRCLSHRRQWAKKTVTCQ